LIAGVFGNPNSAPTTCSQPVISSVESEDTFPVKPSIEPPSGVYGRAVQHNAPLYPEVENDKDVRLSINL
jgi:hypothetical protein